MSSYSGTIITESLVDQGILNELTIIKTVIEKVTESHKTPWIKQWTLHTIEISEVKAHEIAEKISEQFDPVHPWYADFKNDDFHFIIFRKKVFRVDRTKPKEYKEATAYGISLGIPEYQVDFSPHIKIWKR